MLFAVFSRTTKSARRKKQNMVMKTYKKLLASKDSPNCFAIFGSSACQSQHVLSMSFLTCTVPRSSDTNVQELV